MKRHQLLVTTTALALIATGATACGRSSAATDVAASTQQALPTTVAGEIRLRGFESHAGDPAFILSDHPQNPDMRKAADGDPCYGDSGDNVDGTSGAISVTDQAGSIAGRGEAGEPHVDTSGEFAPECVIPFKLDDLQPATFYTITIGRRAVLLSSKDLAASANDLKLEADGSDARYWKLYST